MKSILSFIRNGIASLLSESNQSEQLRMEAFLGQAQTHADLERRQRVWDDSRRRTANVSLGYFR